MIVVKQITAGEVALFKAVRLQALQDAPGAFGASYGQESQRSDSDWLKRVQRWDGDRGVGLLAMDGDLPCGIVGCFIDENNPTAAHLISMWTTATHRRRGVGRLLVNEVLRWAAERSVTALKLMVTCNNQPALDFYQRLGFTRTGRTEPYRNNPAVIEYEMIMAIGR
jgi:ribosomal protein S18 acetylase RimI-like enzyme